MNRNFYWTLRNLKADRSAFVNEYLERLVINEPHSPPMPDVEVVEYGDDNPAFHMHQTIS